MSLAGCQGRDRDVTGSLCIPSQAQVWALGGSTCAQELFGFSLLSVQVCTGGGDKGGAVLGAEAVSKPLW